MSNIQLPQPKYDGDQAIDQVMKTLNRLPLFMTELDAGDGDGGSNLALDALQALAYEGTRYEVATNFKQQGNDCFQTKQYKDAVVFYTKAIAAGASPDPTEDESSEILQGKIDGASESIKLRDLVLTCYLNRAACNLELQNYRRTLNDCKEVLQRDINNVKAYYRSARACLAIDKIDDANECIKIGLRLEPQSNFFKKLKIKVFEREDYLLKLEQQQTQKEMTKKHVVHI
ncbi:hypothetical protein V1514DRAFT_333424 [Lipomyces japonicus]|uniref:uncharacterized protein n=1 Tax=Lipomyces japonicus TaxID=56871 RepID=UPI0034CD6A40